MSQLLTLWGKAQEHPDYDKQQWIALQAELEAKNALLRRWLEWWHLDKDPFTKPAKSEQEGLQLFRDTAALLRR